MKPLSAPYNFVPVTEHIYHPPWAAQVSHDVPFRDSICGSFEIIVTATTPIYIRNGGKFPKGSAARNALLGTARAAYASFYRAYAPDGPFALPGSSLKGMIRSVVEIASFGKLGRLVADEIRTKLTATMPGHVADWPPDLAETIFGFTNEEDGLRSRVSFDTMEAVAGSATPLPEVIGVLGAPHVRYAPTYVRQKITDPKTGQVGGPLRNFDDPTALLNGWKRYPARPGTSTLPPIPYSSRHNGPNPSVGTYFCPLAAGAQFSGRVRIHNLRPFELGALLWALTWGGQMNFRHGLGMAKPCGYGQVGIEINQAALDLALVDGTPAGRAMLAACQSEFIKSMEAGVPGGWAASAPLRHLFAMAVPAQAAGKPLGYADRKAYNDAKFAGPALLPYVP